MIGKFHSAMTTNLGMWSDVLTQQLYQVGARNVKKIRPLPEWSVPRESEQPVPVGSSGTVLYLQQMNHQLPLGR